MQDPTDTQADLNVAHSPDLLIYDLSKYLLSLCLLILGGVLTVTQTVTQAATEPLPPSPIILIVGCLAVSGLLSITCISSIVKARYRGVPARRVRLINQLAMGFLGAGVGAFLVIWIDLLLA